LSNISATEPDWSREAKGYFQWAPSRSLLATIRQYQRHRAQPRPWSFIARPWSVVRHRFWSAVTGADIPINTRIGGGLLLPHPNGVVIHPAVPIGPNCLIFQQVTLGAAHGGLPSVGGHVDIGAGAKVIGAVRLADHSKIGANAVVITDVPEGATAVGVPARVVAATGTIVRGN
jgi:serine O-acetyltransferase